ncbi:MAG: efflux RND transporter permease subunit [Alphaproteobacteria bacterium]|nr:efflux RND transporter permease subunit [Alphaproteobacteria bacterium]MBN2675211.1 efflux RND transporter permease subunit [Alphaproteobacteria bacterium]
MKNENNMKNHKKGIAGFLAEKFIHSHLIPVFIIAALLTGIMAIFLTPKEEEPQISVPMIDIYTNADGLSAKDVENKITKVIEKSVWGETGVDYIYSSSMPNQSMVTVRFNVGEDIEKSLLKVHHKMTIVKNELPQSVRGPVIKSFSIDDVPFLVLTLHSKTVSDYDIRFIAAEMANKLSSTPDISRIDILGGQKRSVRVITDPKKMTNKGVSLLSVADAIKMNSVRIPSGKNWSDENVFDIEIGNSLKTAKDVENIAIGQRWGQVVYVKDVARVIDGAEEKVRASFLNKKNAEPEAAVSLSFAKRNGTNVVSLSHDILEKIQSYNTNKDVEITVVRDYGKTAGDKSNELIHHLILATLSVALLIALAMGFREAIVVSIAIPVTLAITLAIYYFMGYTLNRVTLFALIFSIGILVDDAIVVVENIERHMKSEKVSMARATIKAVSEVGNPTVLATFAVVSAILPMAFVGGLMGPYMEPIPTGASFAMIISLIVAFTVTPWAAIRILKKKEEKKPKDNKPSKLDSLYLKTIIKLLSNKKSMRNFFIMVMVLLMGAFSLLLFKAVKVKMLPFDNKEEFQILMDYPESTSLEQNIKLSNELSAVLLKNPDIKEVQVYSGQAGPYSFSGLVKHTFIRNADYMSDLQVVLKDKEHRSKSSHELIADIRPLISDFAKQKRAISKVLEIPPGPPVMATMIAEVYGPDEESRIAAANDIYKVFQNEPSVVDLDISSRPMRSRAVYNYRSDSGGVMGTSASDIAQLGRLVFSETPVARLDDRNAPEDVFINLSINNQQRQSLNSMDNLTLPSMTSGVVDMSSVLADPVIEETTVLTRKNLKPVVYVTSELSGADEAPVYGILKLSPKINYPMYTILTPWDNSNVSVKWDGEWFMTYEVFRDMGLAFSVVLVLIYILLVGWFKSFSVPIVIMLPIPISLIGIIPGHLLSGVYFTATSMIGFIAGAGIIVRNSIILVDFIEHEIRKGVSPHDAAINSGMIRFRPMLLTAAAVIVGSFVMLSDPILQGLAVSLIFGEIAATLLSRFAVPVLYYYMISKKRQKILLSDDKFNEK